MTLPKELLREVAELPPQGQRELAGFLVKLRLREDGEWRKEMARRIDDKNPANWLSLEEVAKQLDLPAEGQ
jgi:hypothetical protein